MKSSGLEATGVVLFAATAVWMTITAAVAGSSAGPALGSILATGLVLAVSWGVGGRWPTAGLVAVIVGAVVLLAWGPGSGPRTDSFQGPLGYPNATAAFYGIAVIAALLLLVRAGSRAERVAAAVVAIGFLPVILVTRSWAVALLLPMVVLAALVATRLRGPRAAVIVCGTLFIGALLITQLIGATRIGTGVGPLDRTIRDTLSIDRAVLWHEAMTLMVEDPLVGVGPGRFASSSPFAAADRDRGWAHHEFLQAGAESGIPGYVLSVALVVWGFAALWMTANGVATAIAAAGLAIVGIHATIDYVLHFPAVAFSLAAVVGTIAGGSKSRVRAGGPMARAAA